MNQQDLVVEWKRWEHVPFQGWDFSALEGHIQEDALPWDYADLARQAMRSATALLDQGTGGGELLASLADAWPPRVFATEAYPPNVTLSRQRLGPLGATVYAATDTETGTLPLAAASVDLVLNRHAGYNVHEVARVLRPGGLFLTQQVDGCDLGTLIRFFDCRPKWPEQTLDRNLARAESAGLRIERACDWSGHTTFASVGAVVYFLKAVPWLVDDFAVSRHLPYLLRLQQQADSGQALTYRTMRYLLVARKPA